MGDRAIAYGSLVRFGPLSRLRERVPSECEGGEGCQHKEPSPGSPTLATLSRKRERGLVALPANKCDCPAMGEVKEVRVNRSHHIARFN